MFHRQCQVLYNKSRIVSDKIKHIGSLSPTRIPKVSSSKRKSNDFPEGLDMLVTAVSIRIIDWVSILSGTMSLFYPGHLSHLSTRDQVSVLSRASIPSSD